MTIDITKSEEFKLREVWDVHEFARRYRLTKMEESRLKMLHGPFAELRDLLAGRQRSVSLW
ncbi:MULTISPECIES: hypothetical protein [Rhizobium]|jgi:hypothetical protein|uniref:Uncharacterized protein n=1 Tax=Rhizobium altiplani TaxID=1864509 RepID=A0A109J362_9HYPH|nr:MULTISPECIES: hypothetical protein [Rhizobium]KWV41483.1 hypothetical protein AS026_24160 [Rhizobium altiplani]MBD9445440.1 hypothetical protein [Rhizobium sp. RHZ01]MBD9451726.1 hypothetical protein [Rhizobium sp. RHZ02]NMN68508.1 hypothetical protein [Rhizobium sp. 57MFTsu3.2]